MRLSGRLRTRFSITFAAFMICIIVILSLVIGQRSIEQVKSEIGESLSEIAYLKGDKLDHYMWARYGEIHILSQLLELRQPDDLSSIQSLLDQVKQTFPAFSWIGFTNKEGVVIVSTGQILEGVDISARPVYLEALEQTFIGDVHEAVLLANLLPNPSGEDMKFVDISIPINNPNGEFIGVLAAHLSWEWAKEVENSMMEPLQKRLGIEMFIVSSIENTILLGPHEELGSALQLESISQARNGINGWTLETWPDQKKYLTGYVVADGYKEYPGLNWTILVRQPVDAAYAPIRELLVYFYIVGVILAAILAFFGWLIAGRIATPLQQITIAADKLSEGEKVDIPQQKGIIEIEILSNSLKKLVDNLTKTENALGEMEDVAYRDHLTQLPNRIALDYYLEKSMKTNNALLILYLDLDGFKIINDSFGHQIGDKLLIEVAGRLKRSVRSEELVARIGGDEFVIVLTAGNEPIENGRAVAKRIIAMINQPYTIEGETMSIGCSVGGALWPKASSEINEVIRFADEALYHVKRTQKNRVYFHQE